jgi:hypothetical protein
VLPGNELSDSIAPQRAGRRNEEAGPIDLESRKSVYLMMELEAEGETLSILKSSDRLEFAATMIPGGRRCVSLFPAGMT